MAGGRAARDLRRPVLRWSAVALLAFLYYYRMSRKRFGGLAGYFLQVCELAMLAAVIIGWNL